MTSTNSCRIGVMYPQYWAISIGTAKRMRTCQRRLQDITKQENIRSTIPELIPLVKEISRLQSISIVFSALACEAFIFDYGVEYLGKNYMSKYLDRLDPVAKWVVVPMVATGFQLNRDSEAFNALIRLTRMRNELVHAKPVIVKNNDTGAIADIIIKKSDLLSHLLPTHENTLELLMDELKCSPAHSKYFESVTQYMAVEILNAATIREALGNICNNESGIDIL